MVAMVSTLLSLCQTITSFRPLRSPLLFFYFSWFSYSYLTSTAMHSQTGNMQTCTHTESFFYSQSHQVNPLKMVENYRRTVSFLQHAGTCLLFYSLFKLNRQNGDQPVLLSSGMKSACLLVTVSDIVIDLFLIASPVITRLIELLFPQLHSRLMAMICFISLMLWTGHLNCVQL